MSSFYSVGERRASLPFFESPIPRRPRRLWPRAERLFDFDNWPVPKFQGFFGEIKDPNQEVDDEA